MLASYLISDLSKITVLLPFEARKQRIQMFHIQNKNISMFNVTKIMFRAYIPLIIRECSFRLVTLGCFLNFLIVDHSPRLKYNLEEIQQYIKMKEKLGHQVNYSYFFDYSKYEIKSTFNNIFANLVLCTIFGTFITQPLDVVATKILTQTLTTNHLANNETSTSLKYKGLIHGLKTVYYEDGIKKLYFSGLSMRMGFNILSALSVTLLYDNLNNLFNDYYK